MNILRNVAWCIFLVVVGICLQAYIPGLDALAVGVIILLQEKDYKTLLWFLPILVLVQEGMGTRPFGATIIWYTAIIVIFAISSQFFAVKRFLFVFILSACLGAVYYGIAWIMAPLQEISFDTHAMLDKSLLQAIFLPVAWFLVMPTRRWGNDAYVEK